MTYIQIYDLVSNCDDLLGVGVTDKGVIIGNARGTQWLVTTGDYDAASLLAILREEREPNVLTHMSRVVGYFSRISNWNKSKIGELKDRHAGDYRV